MVDNNDCPRIVPGQNWNLQIGSGVGTILIAWLCTIQSRASTAESMQTWSHAPVHMAAKTAESGKRGVLAAAGGVEEDASWKV